MQQKDVFTFTHTPYSYDGGVSVSNTTTVSGEIVTWSDLSEQFILFLRASGYIFDSEVVTMLPVNESGDIVCANVGLALGNFR